MDKIRIFWTHSIMEHHVWDDFSTVEYRQFWEDGMYRFMGAKHEVTRCSVCGAEKLVALEPLWPTGIPKNV